MTVINIQLKSKHLLQFALTRKSQKLSTNQLPNELTDTIFHVSSFVYT